MKTADRLGYKAGELNSKMNLVNVNLCQLSGRRATTGCQHAGTAYSDQMPEQSTPPLSDLCPVHPAKAQAVNARDFDQQNELSSRPLDEAIPRPRPIPPQPQRALPVRPAPLRAKPIVDIPLRALPVE